MAEYVDKNDVYRAAREYVKGEGLLGVVALAIFETAVDKLPAADIGFVKHADWKEDGGGRFICTNCEFVVPEQYGYCPYCGTRMDADL